MEENNISKLKKLAYWLLIIGAALITIFYYSFNIYYVFFTDSTWLIEIIQNHFVATIGLPLAAIASFVLVLLLDYTIGPIRFEIFKIQFEGASGGVVMWVVVFLVITFSISLVW